LWQNLILSNCFCLVTHRHLYRGQAVPDTSKSIVVEVKRKEELETGCAQLIAEAIVLRGDTTCKYVFCYNKILLIFIAA
jgi:hypothetical protein